MTARLLLVALAVACSRTSPPPPATPAAAATAAPAPAATPPPAATPRPAAVADVGSSAPAPAPAAPAAREHEYRSDPSQLIDSATVGTGKHFMAVSESRHASSVGRDILASGGNAVDAAVAVAFAL